MTPLFASVAATGLGAGGIAAILLLSLLAGMVGMAAHNPPGPIQQSSTNTLIALTEFRYQLEDELSKKKLPEMVEMGDQETSDMLETRYPITVTDPIFKSLIADNPEYARIGEIFFELYTDNYQAGVIESAVRLRTAEWARRGWAKQPALHAFAIRSLFERLLAGSATATPYNPRIGGLKGGEVTASVENLGTSTALKVFGVGKPVNPINPGLTVNGGLAVYDSLYTGSAQGTGVGTSNDGGVNNYPGALPLNVDSVRIVRNLFGTQWSPNGYDVRGYDLTHIACGKDLEETLLTLVKDDRLLVASSINGVPQADAPLVERANPLKKYKPIIPIINPFLNEPGVWYPISADEAGKCPWMTLLKVPNNSGRVPGMPGPAIVMADGLEWVIDDENSELYKHGNKVGPARSVAIAALIEAGAGVTIPWRIKRCKPT